MLAGIGCFVWGFMASPERAWINYLVDAFYFVSLGLGGGLILGITSVTSSSWATPYKRIPEALTKFLPYGFLIMLGLFFGIHTLYEWSHHSVVEADPILKGKAIYLNSSFFMIRIVVFFILWIIVTKVMTTLSNRQDQTNDPKITAKLVKWGAVFLIIFGFSYSLASFDWLMSVKPHWFSTIYGVYMFSGLFVNVLAVITFMVIYLQKRGHLIGVVTEDHLHDLGKLIFGFTTFWAYIWISQYLLIWYSNIPEETVYFVSREQHSWDWLFYFNLAINWVIPFFALMSRNSKRSSFILYRVCILLIVGRWLDLYLAVAPDVYEHAGQTNAQIGIIEVGMALGFGCLFTLVVGRALGKSNIVAKNDPFLEEGIHLQQ
jgi:hypothetical protein